MLRNTVRCRVVLRCSVRGFARVSIDVPCRGRGPFYGFADSVDASANANSIANASATWIAKSVANVNANSSAQANAN
eukprot:6030344-Lingulodinium_polyedra.AAC.1